MTISNLNNDYWIFGYGSLIYKPPPHYDIRLPGYIEGYIRRFWQSSSDHRGTPESPGRVVTLVDQETLGKLGVKNHELVDGDCKTWGVAYHILPEKVEEVKEYLDIREQDGYSALWLPFHAYNTKCLEEGQNATKFDNNIKGKNTLTTIKALTYIGTSDNPSFLGVVPIEDLAKVIVNSRGPSGENKEYLYKLSNSLQNLIPGKNINALDHHVQELTEAVKLLEGKAGIDGNGIDDKV